MNTFNPSSAHPARAVQAWQIIVGIAMNRNKITYLDLSRLMYHKDAAGILDDILGHIAHYCNDNNLPPLTSIVVNKNCCQQGSRNSRRWNSYRSFED